MTNASFNPYLGIVAIALAAGTTMAHAQAQAATADTPSAPARKVSVVDSNPNSGASTGSSINPFAAFGRWAGGLTNTVLTNETARLELQGTNGGKRDPLAEFIPLPVIFGQPDYPLMGDGAAQSARTWGNNLNYQGVQMRLLVQDQRTGKFETRPLASGLRVGERFKFAVLSSYDALLDVDQLAGADWHLRRLDHVYPARDKSLPVKAGVVVEVPNGVGESLVFDGSAPNEKLVLSIRSASANQEGFSNQPIYRQDGKDLSTYLQLVPAKQSPIIEQVIGVRP